jgi:hypothetical protein
MLKDIKINAFSVSGKSGEAYEISAEITAEEIMPAEIYKMFKDGKHLVEYIKVYRLGLDDEELHEITYEEFMDRIMVEEL